MIYLFLLLLLCFASASDNTQPPASWTVSAEAGMGYDSNILLNPDIDETSAVPTKEDGARLYASIYGERSISRTDGRDLRMSASIRTIWSIDDEHARADPTLFRFATPVVWRDKKFFGRESRLLFSPYWGMAFMDYDESGQRTTVLQGLGAELNWHWRMSGRWGSGFSLVGEQRHSAVETGADENTDGHFFRLKKFETVRFETKGRHLTTHLAYAVRDTEGTNARYHRIDAGVKFFEPSSFFDGAKWTAEVEAHQAFFKDSDDDREDVNLTFRAGFEKPVNENWSWSFVAETTENSSNIDAADYDRTRVLTLIKYSRVQ